MTFAPFRLLQMIDTDPNIKMKTAKTKSYNTFENIREQKKETRLDMINISKSEIYIYPGPNLASEVSPARHPSL